MKTLHLTLTRKWFDMILSGEKKEEYREIKPYWFQRFVFDHEKVFKFNTGFEYKDGLYIIEGVQHSISKMNWAAVPFDTITFKNGYAADAPEMVIECKGIEIKEGKPEWGADQGVKYFVISLGEIISTKNLHKAKVILDLNRV